MLLKNKRGKPLLFFCCSQKYWIHIFARNYGAHGVHPRMVGTSHTLPTHGGSVDKRFAFPTKTEVFLTKTDVVMSEDRYE